MPTLSINNQVVESVKNKFLSELDKMVSDKEKAVSTAKVVLREAEAGLKEVTDARDVIRKGLGHMVTAKGEMRFVASRTGRNGPGHFIETFDNGDKVTCTCAGFRYNGKCWASDFIRTNEAKNKSSYAGWADRSYNYPYSRTDFEARRKPNTSIFTFLPPGTRQW